MAHDPTSPYRPIYESLAQQKSNSLAQSYNTKINKIEPPAFSIAELVNDQVNQTNAVDLFQSSVINELGYAADAGKDLLNSTIGTDFDASEQSGWSNRQTADDITGVSESYRKQFELDQQAVYENVADNNVAGTLGAARDVAFRTAADSGGSFVSLAAGAGLTALATLFGAPLAVATGGLLFGAKVKNIYDTGKGAKEKYDKITEIKEATRLGKLFKAAKEIPAATAKALAQTSIMNATMLERQVQEYRAKYKDDPSLERVAYMALGIAITNIAQPAIIAKLFVPDFKKGLAKEFRLSIKNLGKGSNLVNIGKRIGSTISDILKAGGAEAAQEYLQTWQEIFAIEISPEEADSLWKAVGSKISDQKLRDKAITGGVLGGAAGGAIRGTISAPTLVAGSAIDATKASLKGVFNTAKVAGRGVDHVRNKVSLKLLSQENRDEIQNAYNIDKQVSDEKVASWEKNITAVNKAKSYEDFKNLGSEVFKTVSKAAKELELNSIDLKDEKNLNKLKAKIVSEIKAKQLEVSTVLESSRVASMARMIGKNVKDMTVEAAEKVIDAVPDEVIRAALDASLKTVAASKAAYKAVKNLNSSTARGIIDMGLKGITENTPLLLKAASNLNKDDLNTVVKIITQSEKNPELAKKLKTMYENRKKAFKDLGLSSDNLINRENLSSIISSVVEEGSLKGKSAAMVGEAILKTTSSKIQDLETLAIVKQAVKIYKESDAFKNKSTKGRIDETNMEITEAKIEKAEKRLTREASVSSVDAVIKTAKSAGTVAKTVVVNFGIKYRDKATRQYQNYKLQRAKKLGPEELALAQKEIEEENIKWKLEKEEEEKLAKAKETTVPEATLLQKSFEAAKVLTTKVRRAIDKFSADVSKHTIREKDGGVTIAIGKNPWLVDNTVVELNSNEISRYNLAKEAKISNEERTKIINTIYRKAVARIITKTAKSAADVTVKTVKKGAKATVEVVKESFTADKKVLSKEADSAFKTVEEADFSKIIGNIPSIIELLKQNNYETETDFNYLIESYPKFKDNKEFYDALKNEFFGSPVVMPKETRIDPEIPVDNKSETDVNSDKIKSTKTNLFGCE